MMSPERAAEAQTVLACFLSESCVARLHWSLHHVACSTSLAAQNAPHDQ